MVPVTSGVAELYCWIGHFPGLWPTGHDTEECLDRHAACGIRHVAWNLGRSVLDYHSDLPGATCLGRTLPPAPLPAQLGAIVAMFGERCQLRAALTHARRHDFVIYGRLAMNRHYQPGTLHRGAFADLHPQWCEVQKSGWLDVTRLCYGVPEVRAERIAILTEAARLGCDGLCLDFCRQPPIAGYHPALAEPYRAETGADPRRLSPTDDQEAWLAWASWRAQAVTAMLRELKAALDPLRERERRAIPVQARIPCDGFEANLLAGLDVRAWVEEGLVDELALSALGWLEGYDAFDERPYVALGVPVFGASNVLPQQYGGWGGQVNPAGINPWVLARRALASLEAGCAGVSVYQSDTGVQWPGLPEVLAILHDADALRAYVEDPAVRERWPVTPENEVFGIDNHSKPPSARVKREAV